MLEKLVASTIVPYLSKFFEDIDEQQLSISLWSGKVTLRDLVLKPAAVQNLLELSQGKEGNSSGSSLPFRVHRGLCKSITIVVPYKNLYSAPVAVEIGEILLSISAESPKEGVVLSKKARLERAAAKKTAKLDKYESMRKKENHKLEQLRKPQSSLSSFFKKALVSRLAEKAFDSFRVSIASIHVRFEDVEEEAVMGIIIGGVQLSTTDGASYPKYEDETENAKAEDRDPISKRLFKSLRLENIQFYCDDEKERLVNKATNRCFMTNIVDWQEWFHAMRQRMRGGGSVSGSTILGPLSLSLDAAIVRRKFVTESLSTPYLSLVAKLNALFVRLTREQYVTVVRTIITLTKWNDVAFVVKMRPAVPVKGNAKRWWQYCIRIVRLALDKTKREKILERVSNELKKEYEPIYRRIVYGEKLTDEMKRCYRFAIRFMNVSDMIACRQRVYTQVAAELKVRRIQMSEMRAVNADPSLSLNSSTNQTTADIIYKNNFDNQTGEGCVNHNRWLSWIYGRKPVEMKETLDEATRKLIEIEKEYGITDADLGEVDEVTQSDKLVSSLPSSFRWLQFRLEVPFVSAGVLLENYNWTLANLYQTNVSFGVFNKDSSALFHFSVQNLTLSNPLHLDNFDDCTEDTNWRQSGESLDCASAPFLEQLVEGIQVSSKTVVGKQRRILVEDLVTKNTNRVALRPLSLKQILGLDEIRSTDSKGRNYITPLIEIAGSLNPVEQPLEDTELDLALRVKVHPLRIVFDPTTLQRIIMFFRLPKGVDISHLQKSTAAVATAVRRTAAQELLYSMTSAKGMYVSLDAHAPLIVLPLTLEKDVAKPAIHASLGRVRIESHPLTNSEKRARLEEMGRSPEETLYYCHRLKLTDFYVENTTINDAFMKPATGFQIIPEITFVGNLLQRIDDRLTSHEPIIVRLRAPNLRLQISVHQFYVIANLIESWISYTRNLAEEKKDLETCENKFLRRRRNLNVSKNVSELNSLDNIENQDAEYDIPNILGAGLLEDDDNSVDSDFSSLLSTPESQRSKPIEGLTIENDIPALKLEILAENLSLKVFEDDLITHAPSKTPRFSFAIGSLEFILARRKHVMKIVLAFQKTTVSDVRNDEAILQVPVLTVEVTVPKGLPVAVGVLAKEDVDLQIGTPFMELLEVVWDVVNMILGLKGFAKRYRPHGHLLKFRKNQQERHTINLVEYQMDIIKERNEKNDHRVVDISIVIEQKASIRFMNRYKLQKKDFPFLVVEGSNVEVYLKKNNVTFGICGFVDSINAMTFEESGLLPNYRTILHFDSNDNNIESGNTKDLRRAPPACANVALGDWRAMRTKPFHVGFSYHTSRPVMPLFEVDKQGKERIKNVSTLRFSKAIGVELGPSVLCVDVHTIMVIKHYFTEGFFSRLATLTDRPLYSGRVMLPPVPGPRLLMSITVSARKVTVSLPLDPRNDDTKTFGLTADWACVQSLLDSTTTYQKYLVDLTNVDFGIQKEGRIYRSLLRTPVDINVVVGNGLSERNKDPMLVDVSLESAQLALYSEDISNLCHLLKRNLSLTGLTTLERATPPIPLLNPVEAAELSGGGLINVLGPSVLLDSKLLYSMSPNATNGVYSMPTHSSTEKGGETILTFNTDELLLDCSTIESASSGKRSRTEAEFTASFRIIGKRFLLNYTLPSNHMLIWWDDLEINDVRRSNAPLSLLRSGAGSMDFFTLITTNAFLVNDFGVRQDDLSDFKILSPESPRYPSKDRSNESGSQSSNKKFKCNLPFLDETVDSVVLLNTTMLKIQFTLDCFAISLQWLDVYDFFCNEAVANAWSLAPPPNVSDPVNPNPLNESSASVVEKGGFRCVLMTPSVRVPFLTATNEPIIEATMEEGYIDMAFLSSGPLFSIKVKSMEVLDCKSKKTILWKTKKKKQKKNIVFDVYKDNDSREKKKKKDDVNNEGRRSNNPLSAGKEKFDNSSIYEDEYSSFFEDISFPADQGEKEALDFRFFGDSITKKSHMVVALGAVEMLVSVPMLYGLLDYCVSPLQPPAMIGSLGIMREQRERIRLLTNPANNEGSLTTMFLWFHPKLFLAQDASSVVSTFSQSAIEARLGKMNTFWIIDRVRNTTTFQVKVDDFYIPEFLNECIVSYNQKIYNQSHKEDVKIVLEKTVFSLNPDIIEKFFILLRKNLSLPRNFCYYGDLMNSDLNENSNEALNPSSNRPINQPSVENIVESAPRSSPADSPSLSPRPSPNMPTPQMNVRTLSLFCKALEFNLCNHKGLHTHTLTLVKIAFDQLPNQDMRAIIPAISLREQYTKKYLVKCVASALPCSILTPSRKEKAVTTSSGELNFVIGTPPVSPSPSPPLAPSANLMSNKTDSSTETVSEGLLRSTSSSPSLSRESTTVPESSRKDSRQFLPQVDLLTSEEKEIKLGALLYEKRACDNTTFIGLVDATLNMYPKGVGTLVNTLTCYKIPEIEQDEEEIDDLSEIVVDNENEEDTHEKAELEIRGETNNLLRERLGSPLQDSGEVGYHAEVLKGSNKVSIGDSDSVDQCSDSLGVSAPDLIPEFSTTLRPSSVPRVTVPPSTDTKLSGSGSKKIRVRNLGCDTPKAPTKRRSTLAPPKPVSKLLFSLGHGNLNFVSGEEILATAQIDTLEYTSESFSDKSLSIYFSITSMKMTDKHSNGSLHKDLLIARPNAHKDQEVDTNVPHVVKLMKVLEESMYSEEKKSESSETPTMASASNFPLPGEGERECVLKMTYKKFSDELVELRSNGPSKLFFSHRLTLNMEDIYVTIIPGITQAILQAVKDISAYINAGNREKMNMYVSEKKANATVMPSLDSNKKEPLLEFSLHVTRVVLYVVPAIGSLNGVLISPGRMQVSNRLLASSDVSGNNSVSTPTASKSFSGYDTELTVLEVDKLIFSVCDANVFCDECRLEVQRNRVFHLEENITELNVLLPSIAINLTKEQMNTLLDFIGLFKRNSTDLAASLSNGENHFVNSVTSDNPINNISNSDLRSSDTTGNLTYSTSISGSTAFAPAPTEGLLTVKRKKQLHERPPDLEDLLPPEVDAEAKPTKNFVQMTISFFEAEISNLFRLRFVGAVYDSESSSQYGSQTNFSMDDLVFQHVGAQVEKEEETAADHGTSDMIGSLVLTPSSRYRPTSRVDDIVDVLTIKSLSFVSQTPNAVVDREEQSISTEATMDLRAESIKIAFSPTVIFDSREELYLPFFYRVLQEPIDPIPVLELREANTLLMGNLTLDDKHILTTNNPLRCSYHVDLNGCSLVFSGPPSGMIVLNEGSDLIFTNGVIVIPGMYTLGSYVSFGPGSSILAGEDVVIQKEFQFFSNTAFAMHSLRPPREALATRQKLHEASDTNPLDRTSSVLSNNSTLDSSTSDLSSTRNRIAGNPSSSKGVVNTAKSGDNSADKYVVRQRKHVWTCNFNTETLQVQMLSEELTDLSISLMGDLRGRCSQETRNDVAINRSANVQLFHLRSGNNEELTLLPTNFALMFSGVDSVSYSILLDSIEFCVRATLLFSIIELGKSFATAFFEDATIKRVRPTVEYEDSEGKRLYPVASAGVCEHCGQYGAYLADSTIDSGRLCYRCSTGKDANPATEMRFEVPIVDLVITGSKGDLEHFYLRNLLFSVDTNMDVQARLKGAVFNFNTRASVWEPFVESIELGASGSLVTHQYNLRISRFDLVLSPQSIAIVSRMVRDFKSLDSIQKELRHQFRQEAKRRNRVIKSGGVSYLSGESALLKANMAIEDSRTFNEEMFDNLGTTFNGGTSSASFGRSVFDIQLSINHPNFRMNHAQNNFVYARIHVRNFCNVSFLIDNHSVGPHGALTKFNTPSRLINVCKFKVKESSGIPAATYSLSLANPPLHVMAKDFILETNLLITKGKRRNLSRAIKINIYPLHVTNTIICFENMMRFPLLLGGASYPSVMPGGRRYINAEKNLYDKLLVAPVLNSMNDDEDKYDNAVNGDGELIPIREALVGHPLTLTSKSSRTRKRINVIVTYKQEAMRGGVPSFVIVFTPQFSIRNKLPYKVTFYTEKQVPNSSSSIASSKDGEGSEAATAATPIVPLKREVEVLSIEENMSQDISVLHDDDLDKLLFQMEIQQPNGKLNEVFTTEERIKFDKSALKKSVTEPYLLTLKSESRQMSVRVIFVRGNQFVLITPFILLNHTPLKLNVKESNEKGDVIASKYNTNYSILPANMNAPLIACPHDYSKGKEKFFVNISTDKYKAVAIPFHVQQTGLIIMYPEELMKDEKKSKSKKGKQVDNSEEKSLKVIHFSYRSTLEKGGDILVEIKPRWVAVNRTPFPLYIVGNKHARISDAEVRAGALAVLQAKKGEAQLKMDEKKKRDSKSDEVEKGADRFSLGDAVLKPETDFAELNDTSSIKTHNDTEMQEEVARMRKELKNFITNESFRLPALEEDWLFIEPNSALEFYKTPYCTEEEGYSMCLQTNKNATLRGAPISLEVIHNEVVLCYKSVAEEELTEQNVSQVLKPWIERADALNKLNEDEERLEALSEDVSVNEDISGDLSRCYEQYKDDADVETRDNFFEVSLVAREPTTFVIIEKPKNLQYVLLNRTNHAIVAVDPIYKNRIIAFARPGSQCELYMDISSTTVLGFYALDAEDKLMNKSPIYYDVSRSMSQNEIEAAPLGLKYFSKYGSYGQIMVEISHVKPFIPIKSQWELAPGTPMDVLMNLSVATVSCISPNQDILFGALTDFRLSWNRGASKEVINYSVKNYQIDNQTEIDPTYESCVLALRKSEDSYALAGVIERKLSTVKSLVHILEVRLDFSPVAVRVSDALLVEVFKFINGLTDLKAVYEKEISNAVNDTDGPASLYAPVHTKSYKTPTERELYGQSPTRMDFMTTRLIVERLIINPVIIRLWFVRDVSQSDFFRESIKSKDAALLSMLVPSCEDINIVTPGVACASRTSRIGVFIEWLSNSYIDGLFSQVKGVLLQYASSLPLIGAPLKLASGISSGAVRWFREPVEGLTTSRSGFGVGLARGSSKFAQGFASGGLGAFSNLSDAGARFFSLGSGLSEKRRKQHNFFQAVASGVKGVVQKPRERAAQDGAAGFVAGLSQGVLGAFTSPFTGILNDLSHGAGVLASRANNTYVPNMKRLRSIRSFYANGGVAPWRSLISVYEYERCNRDLEWGKRLMSGIDGPQWFPCKKEEAQYGKEHLPVPVDYWVLDRYETDLEGWSYSSRYFGRYNGTQNRDVRVRRKRWAALVVPLPHSPIAAYLKINPGMAVAPRSVSRAASFQFDRTLSTGSQSEFVLPGEIATLTAIEADTKDGKDKFVPKRTKRVFSSHTERKRRTTTQFFDDGPEDDTRDRIHKRSASWSSGKGHFGVGSAEINPSPSSGSLGEGSPSDQFKDLNREALQQPTEPAEKRMRNRRSTIATPGCNVSSVGVAINNYDADYSTAKNKKDKKKGKDKSKVSTESSKVEFCPPLSAFEESPPVTNGPNKTIVKTNPKKKSKLRRSPSSLRGSPPPNETLPSRSGNTDSGTSPDTSSPASLRAYEESPPRKLRRFFGNSTNKSKNRSSDMLSPIVLTPSETGANVNSGKLNTSSVDVYEYEKLQADGTWSKRHLPKKCPAWELANGTRVGNQTSIKPPAGYRWMGEWKVCHEGTWEAVEGDATVRRRLWQRSIVAIYKKK